MVSRENKIIGGFILVALLLSYASTVLASAPSDLALLLLLVVGVITPLVVNEYLDATHTT